MTWGLPYFETPQRSVSTSPSRCHQPWPRTVPHCSQVPTMHSYVPIFDDFQHPVHPQTKLQLYHKLHEFYPIKTRFFAEKEHTSNISNTTTSRFFPGGTSRNRWGRSSLPFYHFVGIAHIDHQRLLQSLARPGHPFWPPGGQPSRWRAWGCEASGIWDIPYWYTRVDVDEYVYVVGCK